LASSSNRSALRGGRAEKTVPESRDAGSVLVPRGEDFSIRVSVRRGPRWKSEQAFDVGWIRVYFKADNDDAVYELGDFELNSRDPEKSPVAAGPSVVFSMRIYQPGALLVMTYSLAEGLLVSEKRFAVQG
jgi:hypothetical protein